MALFKRQPKPEDTFSKPLFTPEDRERMERFAVETHRKLSAASMRAENDAGLARLDAEIARHQESFPDSAIDLQPVRDGLERRLGGLVADYESGVNFGDRSPVPSPDQVEVQTPTESTAK